MPSALNIRHADMERLTIALLLLLVFSSEKPGCYSELDLEGYLKALDQVLCLLEIKDPGATKRVKLEDSDRESFIQGVLEHYNNVVSIAKWRGQLLIRFRATSAQGIRRILSYVQVDQAWKSSVWHTCEEARSIYRATVSPREDG